LAVYKQLKLLIFLDFHQDAKVIKMAENKPDDKKSRPIVQQQSKKSQMSLLAGAVKRRG
jgi:hypothetical protein